MHSGGGMPRGGRHSPILAAESAPRSGRFRYHVRPSADAAWRGSEAGRL